MFEDIQQQGGCLFDFVFRTILKDYDIYYSVVFSRGRVNSDPKCMFFSKKKDVFCCQARGRIKSCADYSSGRYCCDCGGGLRLQKWSWDCDLCRPVSLNGCGCKPGPWELFGEISYSECGNPGYTNHMPMCVVDESCKDHFRLGGKILAQCAMYTGFTTKGCRCKRYPKGWTFKGPDGDKFVLNTCGNPNNHKDGPWCNVEENEHECQGDTWGPCEFAKA